MIVRKYGRRGRGLASGSYSGTESYSDVEASQEDVYNFGFSSQESARCRWPDPYSFGSSQEDVLPDGDLDSGHWRAKKLKVVDLDSEPSGINLSQESKDFGGLSISGTTGFKKSKAGKKVVVGSDPSSEDLEDRKGGKGSSVFDFSEGGDVWKPNKFKNFDLDSFGLDSSQENGDLGVSQSGKGRKDSSVFDFSEDGDVWKPSKFTNVDSESYGLGSSQESAEIAISQTRKSGCWEYGGVSRRPKKKEKKQNGVLQKKQKKNKSKMKSEEAAVLDDPVITATLMETQEYGEMMEHVDEVNFALDGLKKGQPVGVRRGSLLSLLSICKTAQQRRLLRVHGMAKTIIDAVLELSCDDLPSNLAAAALFYILTSDCQDDHLLDSPNSIRFLIRMLKPFTSAVANEKAHSIGSKLLGMSKNTGFSKDSAKGTDSSSAAITLKVQEILVSCKEMKPRDDSDNRAEEPEMNPKWISLLTMEKACLTTISIEDTPGSIRNAGGKFKEKLRELGGLNAVFEVARRCHSTIEEWLQKSPDFSVDLKDSTGLESLSVVLKCLRIMENAAFLSKDNQAHLLEMKGDFDGERAPRSFTKLILSVIKILSGVSLRNNSAKRKLSGTSNQSTDSGEFCSMEHMASQKISDESQSNRCANTSINPAPYKSSSERACDLISARMRVESSTAGSCCGTSHSGSVIVISSDSAETELGSKHLISDDSGAMEDSQDPFAFDGDECEPSKWDLLSGRANKSSSQDSRPIINVCQSVNHSVLPLSQQESCNSKNHHSQEASCSTSVDEEKSSLLMDCLLTAVKVLMNLTNDNPEDCRQIAACGGLEVLSSLIAGHFPWFCSIFPKPSLATDKLSSAQLTDQGLDFLVAILGLLVNLIEKDGRNRSRLAAATVSVPIMEGLDLEDERSVIPLFCSIFMANQGGSEAAGEEKEFSWDDEESLIQGEKEAEKMIVQAYAALLVAFLSTERLPVGASVPQLLTVSLRRT